MEDELDKTPIAGTEIVFEPIKRDVFTRLLFSFLWLPPVILVIHMLVGGIVEGMAGAITPSFEASRAFFISYGLYVVLCELIMWLLLCVFGVLPGTSKFKKVKT